VVQLVVAQLHPIISIWPRRMPNKRDLYTRQRLLPSERISTAGAYQSPFTWGGCSEWHVHTHCL